MKVLRDLAKKVDLRSVGQQVRTGLKDARKRAKTLAAGFGLGSAVVGAQAQKVMKGMAKGANKYGKKQYRKGLTTGLVTGAGVTGAGVLGVNAYKKHKDKDND